jgi:hypothetical protein
MINNILKKIIDLSIIAYINRILIYSQTKKVYEKLMEDILSYLQKWNLALLMDKCEYHKSIIKSFDYMISNIGIKIAQYIIWIILEWEYLKI